MTPEDVLTHAPKILTDEQRQFYFANGYLLVENAIPQEWVQRLLATTDQMVDRSRSLTQSDEIFDLEPGHSAANPRLRRLSTPVDHHPEYWAYAAESVLADIAADLVGPNVKFHHAKLNFKWAEGGEEVKWHQDIQFWPHTNYSPLTIGVFLEDVEPGMGNVGFVPGSHLGELFDQYHGDRWVGCISERDLGRVDVAAAVYPTGPAGSITVHNCRTVHGSAPNHSDRNRPLLLQTYAAADAFAYTTLVSGSPRGDRLIRGEPARWARHDPRSCQVGPSRLRTIFEVQQRET